MPEAEAEIDVTPELVRRLLDEQHPDLATLPLRRVARGWDRGRISAVIDFGDMTAGDPASDLAVAWMLLPPAVRSVFRDACGARQPVDDALWTRARGWALALGVAMSNGDERVSAIGRRTLAAVLTDR